MNRRFFAALGLAAYGAACAPRLGAKASAVATGDPAVAPTVATVGATSASTVAVVAVPATASAPAPPPKPERWHVMMGAGECTPLAERRLPKPPLPGHRNCALYRGCPRLPGARPLAPCQHDLAIVSVRDLRGEGGTRAPGSAVAVRGLAKIKTMLESATFAPPAEGYANGKCARREKYLILSTEDEGPCLSVAIEDTPDALLCVGDRTDSCCAANPALPKQGEVAVAVGTYVGTGRIYPEGEGDTIKIDHFCSLPPRGPIMMKSLILFTDHWSSMRTFRSRRLAIRDPS